MLKQQPKALYLTWTAILVALPLPLIILLNTGLLDTNLNLFLYDLGLIAYVRLVG